MGQMINEKNIDSIFNILDIFIESLSTLLGVFKGYKGGDFCAGLIFGTNGA